MLGLGISAWVYALALGLFIGGWLWDKITFAYCPECEVENHIETEYCPDCGKRTVKRQIRRLYTFTPVAERFVEMPQMDESHNDDYEDEGTGYIYEDDNPESPHDLRLYLHKTDVSDEEYIEMYGVVEFDGGDSE